ncbi:MAG: YIP1 family protein, partial [candidate division Zixibacteria bacterium]|nr:YIP1 family protein [candidate division Zixibacteria bacterium]
PLVLCVATLLIYYMETSRYQMMDIKERLKSDQTLSSAEVQRRTNNIDSQIMAPIGSEQVGLMTTVFFPLQAVKLFGISFFVWLALQFFPGKSEFVPILSVVSFSFMVLIPEAIVKIPLIMAKETTQIYLSVAAFLPAAWRDSPLFIFCDKLNIFNIWMAILLMLGLSIVTGISRKRVILTVSYLWFIWLVLATLFGNLVQIN